ncbi:unnamed protein product, partial [Laminaria digitata]
RSRPPLRSRERCVCFVCFLLFLLQKQLTRQKTAVRKVPLLAFPCPLGFLGPNIYSIVLCYSSCSVIPPLHLARCMAHTRFSFPSVKKLSSHPHENLAVITNQLSPLPPL